MRLCCSWQDLLSFFSFTFFQSKTCQILSSSGSYYFLLRPFFDGTRRMCSSSAVRSRSLTALVQVAQSFDLHDAHRGKQRRA
ncbi:putative tubulin--tyrosine ligase C12B10.04 [Fusarium oxysporum f. sp. albedinis]|nr:putative tubulin--tyrosine ligase C12B10.04 [Fusarium oxysporum f. sp. albedinis]